VQAQAELEQAKIQAQAELEQAKMQAEADLEAARLEAQQAKMQAEAEAETLREQEAAEAERLRAEEEAAAAEPVDKELPELPPLDGSAPLPPVQETSGINIPVVLAATGGALGLCAAAFFFIL
jgi:uncharacterized membrane protein YqiK